MSGYVPDAQAQMQPGGHIPYPTDSRDSLSPTPSDTGANAKHRRNYQACEGCRVRKVKCDLGPVDAPHKPPCKRCRRENKPCEFADTRKKRKPSVEGVEDSDNEPSIKRHRPSTNSRDSNSPFSQPGGAYGDEFSPQNWPGHPGIPQMPAPGMIPSRPASNQPPRSYPQVSPSTRQMPFPAPNRSFAGIKHDTNGESREVKSEAAEFVLRPSIETSQSSFTTLINAASAVNSADTRNLNNGQQQMHNGPPSTIRRVNPDGSAMTLQQLAEYNQALNVWNSAVFVRSDFFSAEEGIAYVEYFYDRLQPMTPVVVPDYRHYTRHKALLTKEPILALTILTIASRHMELTGFSQLSRRYTIHENLWRSLTSKVQRLLWGQEQFGGGRSAVNAGKVRELAGGQLTWDGSLRTLGSIEALLILTDWQPRALHFPPGNDDMQLLDRNFPDDAEPDHGQNFAAPKTQIENMPYSSWLEPAWRSDRMSWMLLGLAHSLSYELGVFEDNSGRLSQNDPDALRKTRIRRMVTVYLSQTSGRIGIPSPVAFGSDYTGEMLKDAPDAIDVVHGLWTHIAGIMHSANKLIFPSREFTMNLTRGLEYRERIEHFKPQLDRWQDHFDDVKGRIPPVMQSILAMEFEYARLYINSIGLQHVVESWVRPGANNQQSASTSMAKSVAENKKYIEEFTNAALHILRIVSVQMNHLGVLRDAPVRTFLRTLSAMMFTIKRLSLGTHERMARDSIGLLESVIGLFQGQVVDDVHLSGSTASMIEGILKKVKETMIRVQKPPHTSSVPSRDASRAVSPQLANQSNPANRAYFEAGQQYDNVNHAYSMDPLASIQGRPLADFSDKTFIWPNGWSINELDGQLQMDDAAIDQSVNSETNADWLAMPLDNFNDIANNDTIRVDQGMHSIGPTVGQHDMLEVLMEPAGFDQNLNGMGWGGNNYGHQF